MKQTKRVTYYTTINLTRHKYEIVNVFGFPLKVQVEEIDSFKQELDSLMVMLELLNCRIEVSGNHSLLQIAIYVVGIKAYYLDFHLRCGFFVDASKPIKENSKLKRVSIYYMYNDYICTYEHESSKDFYKTLRRMQELL